MHDGAITMYADYVCPFCYIGQAVLRGVLDERSDPPPVHSHPFDLRGSRRDATGEIVAPEHADESYYEDAWRNVERLAAEYDVEPPDRANRDVDSWNAQRASLAVQEAAPDRWDPFDRRLYRAHWHDGRDIGSPDVIASIAAAADVPDDVVPDALAGEADDLADAFEDARQRGITGVPTFTFDGRSCQGAVPPDRLRALLASKNEDGRTRI